ncbi:hypothetical protein PM082_021529 [Marasmius tenuissimus]|nr:hypothetical protein PM082_021529 [Marasmius tenuissimus]
MATFASSGSKVSCPPPPGGVSATANDSQLQLYHWGPGRLVRSPPSPCICGLTVAVLGSNDPLSLNTAESRRGCETTGLFDYRYLPVWINKMGHSPPLTMFALYIAAQKSKELQIPTLLDCSVLNKIRQHIHRRDYISASNGILSPVRSMQCWPRLFNSQRLFVSSPFAHLSMLFDYYTESKYSLNALIYLPPLLPCSIPSLTRLLCI